MIQATSCPSAPVLQRLLFGQKVEEEFVSVVEHLLTCEKCLFTINMAASKETLISALQGGGGFVTPAPRSELLEKLRQRLQEMPHCSLDADTASLENQRAQPPAPGFEPMPADCVLLAPPTQADEIGRLAGYRILQEIGRGGMGVVYKAEDPKLKRLVAIKVMLPRPAADDSARRRFLREAQAMAAVHHDNVVAIHQVDEANGVPFLAMEFLQGMPLGQWMKNGHKPSLAQILRISREIAEGLAAAHARGLIHRDIKPGNIWLDSDHKDRIKILDFGLAQIGSEDVHLTRTGIVVGTPAYMSPEQAGGEKVDARTDLFSLGCVLYRLCTGAMPFAGDTTMALLTDLAVSHPKPVRDLNPAVPVGLSDLVMRLLAKKPQDRPASAQEVVEALQTIERTSAGEQTAGYMLAASAQPTGTRPANRRASEEKERRPYILTAVAAMFLAAIVLGALVVIIRDKNGNKTAEVVLPEGATLKIGQDEKPDTALAPSGEGWVERVGLLPAEKQIKEVVAELQRLNPGFDGVVAPTIRDGVVTELRFTTDKITNVAPVRALKSLKRLACPGSAPGAGRLIDLSPLKDLRLTGLDCGFSAIYDLAPLKDMKLTELQCFGSPIANLAPLKEMELVTATIGDSNVADLSPLKNSKLNLLNVSYTPLSDVSSLKNGGVKILNISFTRVSDLAPLKGTPLIDLLCQHTQVSDLAPLKGMPLIYLHIENTRITDLSPLKNMPLKVLSCDFKPERDAEILRSIKTLEQINNKPAAEFWKEADAKPTEKKP